MTEIKVSEHTINRVLEVLNVQREFISKEVSERKMENQKAYYQGMYDIAQLILSNDYYTHNQIWFNEFSCSHNI